MAGQKAAAAKGLERPGRPSSARWGWACVVLIVLAGAGAYGNSFGGPFLFDDEAAIVDNATIRRLWPVGGVLNPPAEGQAVQRRPVVNLSLAINYAMGGLTVCGYHATNVGLHILAALALLGVVRRTLESPRMQSRFGGQALGLATAVAAIWALHPLPTEAVTYIIQRTEVLAGLFYLLTLYAVIRSADSPARYGWYAAATGACLLAMGSKESAVSAPLVVLVYDRIFLSGSWRTAFRKRWMLYVGLAGTWAVVLVMIPRGNEGSRIFGEPQGQVQYALAQGEAIVRYLGLSVWPARLVVDHGYCPPQEWGRAWPYLAGVAALLGATVWAFWRRAEAAFLGVWFFAILAPSSSLVPLPQQVAAEKRMYLPLAAVVTLAVLGGWALWRRLAPRRSAWAPVAVAVAVAAGLGARTVARNADYRSAESIWRNAVEGWPGNYRAQNNLGDALRDLGRLDEAIEHFREALRIKPDCAQSHTNWGSVLRAKNRPEEAVEHYAQAVRIDPRCGDAQYNWGNALGDMGRPGEAAEHYRAALRIDPDNAEACNNLAWVLATGTEPGGAAEAVALAQRACRLSERRDPSHLDTLSVAYAAAGRFEEAVATARAALELAAAGKNAALAAEITGRLELFRAGRAYRPETPATRP
ncbi:MAG: tetratricopeptide repeat protein [Planctomycetota bacterium]|nr:tetratricopeptide repeat protein [Planctomycetota bacterium]